jgi:hypothetical protein
MILLGLLTKLHVHRKGPNDVDLHFLYKKRAKTIENWKKLSLMINVMDFFQ